MSELYFHKPRTMRNRYFTVKKKKQMKEEEQMDNFLLSASILQVQISDIIGEQDGVNTDLILQNPGFPI